MADDELDPSKRDHALALVRGAASAIPVVGGSVTEAIASIVREQRLDRVVQYVRELAKRLDELDLKINAENSLTVDLLEDTVVQSARALTKERINYLAAIMAENTDASEEQYEFNKKLLQILAQLTDRDIQILKGHTDFATLVSLRRASRWSEPMTVAERKSLGSEEKFEREAKSVAFDVHVETLERLGLLAPERELPSGSGHIVEHGGPMLPNVGHLDRDTGLPKIQAYKVTTLGRLLLTRVSGTYFD